MYKKIHYLKGVFCTFFKFPSQKYQKQFTLFGINLPSKKSDIKDRIKLSVPFGTGGEYGYSSFIDGSFPKSNLK